jgi:hypothetical protein
LGHEIGHCIGRHSSNKLSYVPFGFLIDYVIQSVAPVLSSLTQIGVLAYSRTHEQEADYIGVRLMAMACYDISIAPTFYDKVLGQLPDGSIQTYGTSDKVLEVKEHSIFPFLFFFEDFFLLFVVTSFLFFPVSP